MKNFKIKTISLYSDENCKFHIDLQPETGWEFLAKISQESRFLRTVEKAADRVDKSVVKAIKIVKKEGRCI